MKIQKKADHFWSADGAVSFVREQRASSRHVGLDHRSLLTALCSKQLLRCRHFAHADGVAFRGAGHLCVLAGQFVQFSEGLFVVAL